MVNLAHSFVMAKPVGMIDAYEDMAIE